jgi:ribosomal protein S18 acetylase RimI-like enzyme
VHYEPATEADKEYFRNLNHSCYRDVIKRQFDKWDQEQQDRNFEEKWPTNNFLKVIADDCVIGGVWVDEHSDYLQLHEIQIHPDFQGRGYGSTVVSNVIARAKREGKGLRLRVLHENKAVELYERLGFRTIETTEHQYIMEYS